MFSFGKNKRVVNLSIDDYAIRMVENNGKDLSSIKITQEKQIPQSIIDRGKIVDELAFFDFMKSLVQQWGVKHRQVRFFAPHDLVIMREIDIPSVPHDEVNEYITMEIGNTIHFPFKHPVFDIYDLPETETVEKVTVLAAPEEEISKYTEIFADAKLTPIAVEVHGLGTYRYFLSQQHAINKDDVYLFFELNMTAVNISIFHKHKLEFLRYHPLNIANSDWKATEDEAGLRWTFTGDKTDLQGEISDQINDIERLMNFYQFSLHQGGQTVTQIVLLGDYPELDDIKSRLQERYETPITLLTNEEVSSVFIPVLGLALKGEK